MASQVRILVTGDCAGLGALGQELERAGMAVVRAQGSPRELASQLAAHAPQVILHGSGGRPAVDEVVAIREHTRVPVVLVTTDRCTDVVDDALAAGLADVLLLPQPVEAVLFSIRKLAQSRDAGLSPGNGKVVTVFSPKGGTGKSVTATNLAAALAALQHRRTLLVDLDLQFGDAAIMLGLEPYKTLYDLACGGGDLDAEKLAGYATVHASGLHVLAAPLRPEDAELLSDATIAHLLQAAAAAYDVVVVDSPPFLHGPILTALDRTDELLLLCTPDVPTMKNIRLTLQTLELLAFPSERVRLVLNRTSPQLGLSARDVRSALERPIDFELPSDAAVAIGVNRGNPAVVATRNAPFSRALLALAEGLFPTTPSVARSSRRRRFALGRVPA